MAILVFIVFGFVVGLIARALMPGRQSMGFIMTALLGIAGSFAGGFVGNLMSGRDASAFTPAGIIGSVAGALLVLAVLGGLARRTA
jgi:uncharacterized membrane protein YeaQ/YmgE (transglycosylase-associated protein family)